MIENVEEGMTIYFYQYVDSPIEEGIVKDPKVQIACRDIKFITKVNWENGTTSGARLDHCFTSFEGARGAQKIERDKHIEELKSEITDLVSLLEFPLKHNVRDGEYCDFFAQKIYKEFVEGIKNENYTYSSGVGK